MLVNGSDLTQARPRKNWMGRTAVAYRDPAVAPTG